MCFPINSTTMMDSNGGAVSFGILALRRIVCCLQRASYQVYHAASWRAYESSGEQQAEAPVFVTSQLTYWHCVLQPFFLPGVSGMGLLGWRLDG
jgi:hypothetical protein